MISGWLAPLLDRIARDLGTVVAPVIEIISDDTLQFHVTNPRGVQVGGFKWGLIVRCLFVRLLQVNLAF